MSIAVMFTLILVTFMADIRLVALGGLGICLVQLFYRYPLLLVSLWPAVNLTTVIFPNFSLRAGPFEFQIMDPVYFFTVAHLGLWAVFHPLQISKVVKENRALAGFLALVILYICLYTSVYGHSALGEARKFYFMFFFPLLARTAIRRPKDIHGFILTITGVAVCVALYAVIQTTMQGSIVRSIYSPGALIAALVGCALLTQRIHRITAITPMADGIIILLLFAIAVGTAHRTVWLATGTGLLLMCWINRKRSAVVTKVCMLLITSIFALSLAVVVFPQMSSQLTTKFEGLMDPTTDETGSWRIEGWRQQLNALEGWEVVFGNGLGGYYRWRQDQYVTITASPHNGYIQLVLKFGIAGLVIYLLVATGTFYKAFVTRRKIIAGPMKAYVEAGIVSFGAAHAYVLGYGFEPIILMFLGIIAATAGLLRTSPEILQKAAERRNYVTVQYAQHPYGLIAGDLGHQRPVQR